MNAYSFSFIILGSLLFYYGFLLDHIVFSTISYWLGTCFFCVGSSYGFKSTAVFGKNNDGKLAPAHRAFMFPYLLYTRFTWNILRYVIREDVFNELIPGVFIGRRTVAGELPGNIKLIIDLTCEFDEADEVKKQREYICFQMLDGFAPRPLELKKLIERIKNYDGDIYIHCAQGHGRTGLAACALVLSKGLAKTPKEAVDLVISKRPKVRLNSIQQAFLERNFELFTA